MIEDRIRNPQLRSLLMSPEEAAAFICSGMTVGFGGYTSSGYPKIIAQELVRRRKSGEELVISVVTGSNNGPLDTLFAESELISRRAPMIESRQLAKLINAGRVQYVEQQMNKMPRLLSSGAFGKIDVAVVEALAITEDGGIVPTSSCGMAPNILDAAERVIVEINLAQPECLEAMHDIYRPVRGEPIPLRDVGERIGRSSITLQPGKICAIVGSNIPDSMGDLAPASDAQRRITDNLLNFLEIEMRSKPLPPVQTGFGNLASEIADALGRSAFRDIEFFCGGVQDANLRLAESGKARAISCGSIRMSGEVTDMLRRSSALRERVVIRNGEITNSSEVISRMGLISLNSGIEMDIYGNVNSSHISGSKVVNGLGGGANFAENAGLSVMLIQSENKNGAISTIVPMVSHQDISEHDIDVVVTENGVADLRGKSDTERAEAIISQCAGSYKDALSDYFRRACASTGGHHPILLDEALSWHIRLMETGSMRF